MPNFYRIHTCSASKIWQTPTPTFWSSSALNKCKLKMLSLKIHINTSVEKHNAYFKTKLFISLLHCYTHVNNVIFIQSIFNFSSSFPVKIYTRDFVASDDLFKLRAWSRYLNISGRWTCIGIFMWEQLWIHSRLKMFCPNSSNKWPGESVPWH